MEYGSAHGVEVFHCALARRTAMHCHRLQSIAHAGLHPKALLDRLEAPELRLLPWYILGSDRRGRSREPRTIHKPQNTEAAQDYPRLRNRDPSRQRWSDKSPTKRNWDHF